MFCLDAFAPPSSPEERRERRKTAAKIQKTSIIANPSKRKTRPKVQTEKHGGYAGLTPLTAWQGEKVITFAN